MQTSTLTRLALCQIDDLPVGLGRSFEVGETPIAVFRTRAGKVFATDAFCTHKGGPLADGMLAGEQVVCPYHAFRFDSQTGECDQASVCAIATYPIDVAADGGVFITV